MEFITNFLHRILGNFIWASIATMCYMTYQNSIIAPGNKLLWLSLGLLAVFMYLQFKSIDHMLKLGVVKAFSSNHNSPITRIYLRLIVLCGFLLFVFLIGLNVYVYVGGESVRVQMGTGESFFLFANYRFFGILWGVLICAGFSMGLSAFLFSTFLLGPLANGLTIALALHNWFNGLEFDLGGVFQALLDTSLSDVASLIINISWTILTFIISGSIK